MGLRHVFVINKQAHLWDIGNRHLCPLPALDSGPKSRAVNELGKDSVIKSADTAAARAYHLYDNVGGFWEFEA